MFQSQKQGALMLLDHITSGFAGASSAEGIVGARSGRLSGGTPAKPGFLLCKKCAQIENTK
jgi:hypothetical protein